VIDFTLQDLNLAYPKISEERRQALLASKAILEAEAD